MSFITRIANIFSKKTTSQRLGIALRNNAISLCSIPEHSETQEIPSSNHHAKAFFHEAALEDNDYIKTIENLSPDLELTGLTHLVLNDQQSHIVQVDKPSVPEADIKSALKWQIKDLVPITPDNMVLDYYDAPNMMSAAEKVNVVCAPLAELKAMVKTLSELDVEMTTIITQEFAFANLLPVQSDACLLVCQQPNEEIVLLIIKQGQLFFHRRLRGFSQIANQSEEELSFSVIDNLSLEIQRSTDYFERQLKQAPVKEIKVLLPIALEGFFARKLSENTNVPVTLLDLPRPYHEHREYAVALGASLGVQLAIDNEDAAAEQGQA